MCETVKKLYHGGGGLLLANLRVKHVTFTGVFSQIWMLEIFRKIINGISQKISSYTGDKGHNYPSGKDWTNKSRELPYKTSSLSSLNVMFKICSSKKFSHENSQFRCT